MTRLPAQLEDVSCYPYITQELLNRGHKPDDIRKILGGNLLTPRGAEKAATEKKGQTRLTVYLRPSPFCEKDTASQSENPLPSRERAG